MIKFGEQLGMSIIASLTATFYFTLWFFSGRPLVIASIFLLVMYLLYFVTVRTNVRRFFWLLYGFTQLGLISLFIIVEWYTAMILVMALAVSSAIVLLLWSRRVPAPIVFIREKPLRRAVSLVITAAFFAYVSFGHAVLVFFPSPWLGWLVHPLIALLAMFATYLYWSLYFSPRDRAFILPVSVLGLIMFEASIVTRFTSFGYLAIGLILAWLSYLLQVFIRYHHDQRDIDWKHQRSLLITNSFLFVLFVWLIRYI